MTEKIMNLYETLTDYMNGVLAVICTILLFILALGLAFGIIMLGAWILMMVYNVLAGALGWPTFSIWFWLGVEIIISWLKKGVIAVKNHD